MHTPPTPKCIPHKAELDKFSKKSRSHSKILDARRFAWNRFHTEHPQILGATVQNLVARATWRPAFVYRNPELLAQWMSWLRVLLFRSARTVLYSGNSSWNLGHDLIPCYCIFAISISCRVSISACVCVCVCVFACLHVVLLSPNSCKKVHWASYCVPFEEPHHLKQRGWLRCVRSVLTLNKSGAHAVCLYRFVNKQDCLCKHH